jgi:hypothetical protein
VAIGTISIPSSAASTVSKGATGSVALTTQDCKDSGRTPITFCLPAPLTSTTSEAMITSMTLNRNGTVTTSQTFYTVSTGKIFRLQSIAAQAQVGAASDPIFNIRANFAGGTVTTASPLLIPMILGATSSGSSNFVTINVAGGLELPSGATLGVSQVGGNTASTYGIFIIIGYEY